MDSWKDNFNNAKSKAGADFDFDSEFDNATGGTDKKGPDSSYENSERKLKIDRLIAFYKKIVSASTWDEIFPVNTTLSKDKQRSEIKKLRMRLLKEYHEDKFNGNVSHDPFPKEITELARKASSLLNAFYDEASASIDGAGFADKERTRKSNQASYKATSDADIAAGLAAEAEIQKAKVGADPNGENATDDADAKGNTDNTQQEAGAEPEGETVDDAEPDFSSTSESGFQSQESADRVETGENQEAETEGTENDPVLETLEAALSDARGMYADTDYRDGKLSERLRKALNLRPREGQEENANVATVRARYEAALANLKNYQLEKIKQGGAEGKELETQLKELLTYFNYQEAINFYDARTQAKMDYLAQSDGKGIIKQGWDKLRLGTTWIAESYNKKVPLGVKIGLSLASFTPGLAAFALGKRAWGAFMMAAAGGMQIDKMAQFKDRISNTIEGKLVLSDTRTEQGEIDFDRFSQLLDGKILGLDQKLAQHTMRSHVNKFLAFGAAFAGAYGVLHAFDAAHASDIQTPGYEAKTLFGKPGEVDPPFNPSNMPPGVMSSGIDTKTPLTDAFENRVSSGSEQVFTINKGSSFIGTLNKHFDEIKGSVLAKHPEWNGMSRDQITMKLAQEFAKNHNEGHMPDYVQEGLKMKIVNGEVVLGTEKDWGWYEYVDQEAPKPPVPEAPEAPETPEVPTPEPEVDGGESSVVQPKQDSIPYDSEHDYRKLETEMKAENTLGELNEKYREAADRALHSSDPSVEEYARLGESDELTNNPAGETIYDRMGKVDRLRKEVSTLLNEMRVEDAPWKGVGTVDKLLETGAGSKQILKVSLDNLVQGHSNKLAYWAEIKNKPFMEVAFTGKESSQMQKGFEAVVRQFAPIIGREAVLPDADNNETAGKWLARITRLALEKKAQSK